jgi:very-short-patch-repair endonuclease
MKKRIIYPYNPKLKLLARNLRKNSTLGEILLWKQLKGKQMCGYDFHRDKPLLDYIVDFFCHELFLAIEIDGCSHDDTKYDYDQERQHRIEQLGISFLRFTEEDVKKNMSGVLLSIETWIEEFEKKQASSSGGTTA